MPEKREQTMTDEQTYAPYCLHCEKEGHRTRDCWSTHCVTPRSTEINSLSAHPTPAPTMVDERGISIDFKQAAELLAMFGGEPAEITLLAGPGHSGDGLYAYFNDLPEEGAEFLGVTDNEAVPATRPTLQSLGGDAGGAVDFSDDFVEHSHPQYGSGFFCTPDVFDRIAALSLASTEKSDGWLPIETVPKDGTSVLVWCDGDLIPSIAFNSNGRWGYSRGYALRAKPIRWQPLPAAPKAAEKSGRSE